jgi:hypothetical protein
VGAEVGSELEALEPQQLAFADGSQQLACSEAGQQAVPGAWAVSEAVVCTGVLVVLVMSFFLGAVRCAFARKTAGGPDGRRIS